MSTQIPPNPEGKTDPQWLSAIARVSAGLNTMAAVFAAVILALMTALIIVEIVLRFFDTSTYMADAFVSYGVAALTFLAAPWALEHGAMIRVKLLLDRVHGLPRVLAEGFTLLSTGWMLWFLLAYEWKTLTKLWDRGSVSQHIVPVPLWIPEAFFTAGLVLMLFQIVVRALRLIALRQSDNRAVTL
ncbi:TRAP transporter small permease [Celeribacter litoreus]|uniref:TRAP transporter small permease n=1 Tax=Celeribacter litoreus TaxID=2876714 RepID=UPI001CCF11F7|nr:TRAP transporter small permease [Celeribacter litoreus]MCA0044916.1 TRAP transporter small permease [Celeribacter litoreus]